MSLFRFELFLGLYSCLNSFASRYPWFYYFFWGGGGGDCWDSSHCPLPLPSRCFSSLRREALQILAVRAGHGLRRWKSPKGRHGQQANGEHTDANGMSQTILNVALEGRVSAAASALLDFPSQTKKSSNGCDGIPAIGVSDPEPVVIV